MWQKLDFNNLPPLGERIVVLANKIGGEHASTVYLIKWECDLGYRFLMPLLGDESTFMPFEDVTHWSYLPDEEIYKNE